jgi:ring-1,2-phenylacetyl-CoA epoxidase subunit PaaE
VTVTIRTPTRRRPLFHDLPVRAVDRLTEDAVAITFGVPEALREHFAFRAGQHLTVRRLADGEDVRRSYSICSTPAALAEDGTLRIGVKQIPGGAFSAFAASSLRPGDTVQVLAPLGHFSSDFDAGRGRHYAAVVAGSGITPVLSLVATALADEPASRFTVLFGNRSGATVMFAEELADLKDRYPDRLHLVHVFSREPQQSPLLTGRLDAQRLDALLDVLLDPATVDEWFLCGPQGMVLDAREVLAARGVADSQVRTELFHVADAPEPPASPPTGEQAGEVAVTVVLDGRASTVTMGRHERVLDAALRVRPELPFACRGGVCSTCRAKLVSGQVTMAHNYALEPDELAAGYVLTCQSSPNTEELTVDYDV